MTRDKDEERLRGIVSVCATDAGLPVFGVTTAEPFDDTLAILRKREARAILPRFVSRDLPQRCEPRASLASAASIISFAIPYYGGSTGKMAEASLYPHGRIARFACGPDYHVELERRMEAFVRNLERSLGVDLRHRIFVDTGPLVDRAVAVRAGVGWFGNNACVITPQYGSWVVLGEVITDLELPPDKALERDCGTCRRCIQACPTGAIEAPHVVVPEKCLSYITQSKGVVPSEYRKLLGNRLYGCDTCQEVCPHNQSCAHDVAPQEDISPDLLRLTRMTKQEFNSVYGNTAIGWRGRTVIQRNAIIVLGNFQSPHVCEHLRPLLSDPRNTIRAHAIWALSQYRPSWLENTLHKMLEMEKDPIVIEELYAAVAE